MKVIQMQYDTKISDDFTGILEFRDGEKRWFLNGKRNREDGPAIECPNGNKFWFLNGKYHCENGPAIERIDGTKKWYLNGEEYSEEQWKIEVEKLQADRAKKAKEVPTMQMIKVNEVTEIPNDFTGILEFSNGAKLWKVNGNWHREDGPAYEREDGTKEWWLSNCQYTEEQWKIEVEKLREKENDFNEKNVRLGISASENVP
jgi:hypothetical protein